MARTRARIARRMRQSEGEELSTTAASQVDSVGFASAVELVCAGKASMLSLLMVAVVF